jgi:biopolymer transport protein ExbB
VGEALIMTGLGLAVAIPAVMAYNLYTRRNRVIASQLDAFAGELCTFVAMGQPLGAPITTAHAATPPVDRASDAATTGLARHSGPVAA